MTEFKNGIKDADKSDWISSDSNTEMRMTRTANNYRILDQLVRENTTIDHVLTPVLQQDEEEDSIVESQEELKFDTNQEFQQGAYRQSSLARSRMHLS